MLKLMLKLMSRRDLLTTAVLGAIGAMAGNKLYAQESPTLLATKDNTSIPDQTRYYHFTADQLKKKFQMVQAGAEEKGFVFHQLTPTSPALEVRSGIGASKKHHGPFFEYHETVDHIYMPVAGEYEFYIGGKIEDARERRLGTWSGDRCVGYETVIGRAGDLIVIPRMIVHGGLTPYLCSMLMFATGPDPAFTRVGA